MLDWKKIDFPRLCMKVEEAVVHGRHGPVKTEYSEDELPLDPEIATILLDWKRASNGGDVGLLFSSHLQLLVVVNTAPFQLSMDKWHLWQSVEVPDAMLRIIGFCKIFGVATDALG